ncbi:MAG: DNA primase [Ignavibacteriaceae bacterium]|nr:DNA primase [Ignavibacteriaceae bacterium]
MRIPENKIEEIRSAVNIVDIISEFINLRKRGKNFLGICPFHNEKTPSFTVSEEKQIFHCFGCHSGGNVFKFLMEYEKISFIESVKSVADRLGIQIEFEDQQNPEKQSEQEILYDVNDFAAKYFSDILLNENEGEIGRKYFHRRKIKTQTIRAFGLGFASFKRDAFVEFAKNRIDLEKALQLGLIGKGNEGHLFDKFSGRIIFPIDSPNGRVVGFGGRILEKSEYTAKYLNSPESIIYTKGKVLYGLSHAKDEIRRLTKVIMVEGYMDLISLFQNGIKNVVAVSGTALTEDQVSLLSRYTKNVVLLFDADIAGVKASMRSIEILLRKDFEIKIASLPKGEDPDSYVNQFGREKFDDLIKLSVSFHEYQTALYEAEGYFTDSSRSAEAIRNLVKSLSFMEDELKRNFYIKNISKRFGLREKLLESELDKILMKENRQDKSPKEKTQSYKVFPNKEIKITPEVQFLERDIILLFLSGNIDLIKFIFNHISPKDLIIELNRKTAELVFEEINNKNSFEVASVIDKIDDEELKEYLHKLSIDKYSISSSWEKLYPGKDNYSVLSKVCMDTMKKFRTVQIDNQINDILVQVKDATSEDQGVELLHILNQYHADKKRLNEEFI